MQLAIVYNCIIYQYFIIILLEIQLAWYCIKIRRMMGRKERY